MKTKSCNLVTNHAII